MSLYWDYYSLVRDYRRLIVNLEYETEPTSYFNLEKYVETDSRPITLVYLNELEKYERVRKWKRCKAFQDLVTEIIEYMRRTLVHKHERFRLLSAIWYFNQDLFDDYFPEIWECVCEIPYFIPIR